MKEINNKYTNIVLNKNGTLKQRIERSKAMHSLDLGVSKSDVAYKPLLEKRNSMNNWRTK